MVSRPDAAPSRPPGGSLGHLRIAWSGAPEVLSRGEHPRVLRYGVAAAVVSLALALTLLLHAQVERTLLLFFYGAVAVSAVYGGLGPALLASVLTVVLVGFFFPGPDRAVTPTLPAGLLALAVFAVIAASLSRLGESHRAARRRAGEEIRRTADDQGFLLAAARDLTTSLELQAVLDRVATLSVPRIGRFAAVYLEAGDGSYVRGSHAPAGSEGGAPLSWIDDHVRGALAQPDGAHRRALLAGRPLAVVDPGGAVVLAPGSGSLAASAADRANSYVLAPLTGAGGAFGFFVAGPLAEDSADDGRWLTLVELFAERAALAMENARLYKEVHDEHVEALRSAQLEKQLTQARLDALRAQLNPHFLFNALNSVAMLVRRDAKAEALEGVLAVTELLRSVLGGRGIAECPLRDELTFVQHYLAVERLRYRDRLTVTADVGADVLEAIVPSFLLQPLVENSVRHGVARRRGPGHVEVRAYRAGDTLHLEVCDDGPGFPVGWTPASSTGIGLRNTVERLERLYGASHQFQTVNRPMGGASVRIAMPFRGADGGRA